MTRLGFMIHHQIHAEINHGVTHEQKETFSPNRWGHHAGCYFIELQ